MKKLAIVLLSLALVFGMSGMASAYSFEDKIDYWNVTGDSYGEDFDLFAHPFDSVFIGQNDPLYYTHDINDDVNLLAGDQVTSANLELDFTNEEGDEVGSFWIFTWDKREFASYGFDGNAWQNIGEVDDGQYDLVVNIDWLNDDGFLDVALSVSNPLGTATAWLDHSILTGEAAPIPEPATILLMGAGLLGLAGFGRKKMSKKG